MTTFLTSEHGWSLQGVRRNFMGQSAPSHILFRPRMFRPITYLSHFVTFPVTFFFLLVCLSNSMRICQYSCSLPMWKKTYQSWQCWCPDLRRTWFEMRNGGVRYETFFAVGWEILRLVYFFTIMETAVCLLHLKMLFLELKAFYFSFWLVGWSSS